MAEKEVERNIPPSKEVVGIQMILYECLMRGTLTTEMLNKFKKYLDTDIAIRACEPCSKGLVFVEWVDKGDVSDRTIDETLNLIQTGYCQCQDVDAAKKTKVLGIRLIHRMAMADQNLPLLICLHQLGCDINAQTLNTRDTPLLIAIQFEQFETVKFLVENGVDINMGTGSSIYHVSPLRTALERGNREIVKLLLGAKYIDLNGYDSHNESVLATSLSHYPDFISMLMEAGCDPNCTDRFGRTPLTLMANSRNTNMVKLLIQHGADVNKKDFSNTVALLKSVRLGDIETAAVLLEAGADPNFCSQFENKSLITQACSNGYTDIVRLLIKHGGDVNLMSGRRYGAIHYAAWNGQNEIVKLLLDAGAEYDNQTACKNTPLALAAHGGHLETMKILLSKGCDVNNADRDGDTPLFYVATLGMTDGVKLLLDNGADPNVCDKSGASVLWTAVNHGHKDVVKQLILAFVEKEVPSRGMDRQRFSDQIYYYYQSPKSPLYVAVDKRHLEIALLLISAGYNINNECGWLPRSEFFESQEKAELLQELLQRIGTPLSLLIICRNHLHHYLGRCQLPQKVDKLDLPTFLKKYLLYTDLQDD